MTDFPQLLLVFFAVINPAGSSQLLGHLAGRARTRAALLGFLVGGGLLVASVLSAETILNFLEIEPETFRIAAGIVITAWGVRWMLPIARKDAGPTELLFSGALPLGWPAIANPAAVAASLSFGADSGQLGAIAAALVFTATAVVVAFFMNERWRQPAVWASFTTGALTVIIGANLIVDGVLAV